MSDIECVFTNWYRSGKLAHVERKTASGPSGRKRYLADVLSLKFENIIYF